MKRINSIWSIFCPLILLFLISQKSYASDVKISNISISDINIEKRFAYVKFDIEWKNSWRCDIPGDSGFEEPANWDAVWIFIKYYTDNNWHHALLSQLRKQHIIPNGIESEPSFDGKGIFLYRKGNGKGNLHCEDIKLKWNFSGENINITNDIKIKVFALEMVYIPEGPFFAGDRKSTGCFYDKDTKEPVLISNTSSIVKARKNQFDDNEIISKGIIIGDGITTQANDFSNPEFPTGYKAFYIMKYEISQQQYTDFLNTLTEKQAYTRKLNEFGRYNNFIKRNELSYECSDKVIACNFLSWMDGAAFADWAGLRPMSELEYEKACRGGFNVIKSIVNNPVQGEYAWNNNEISPVKIKNVNDTLHIQIEGNACFENSMIDNNRFLGPLAIGIFEHKKLKTKKELGASYYGVMELSGNLTEQCVTIGNAAGRSFSALNGDGCLNTSGDADVSGWPGINGNNDDSYPNLEYLGNAIDSPGVKGSAGSGQRGGNWNQAKELLAVSNRTFASRKPKSRNSELGFRCARSSDGK